ncbi:cadherin-23-like isoform X2 [Saccostrea echinata]|uniref:cadherin-23-like isoform X2 n=1 Tax=Saccostrea echinata TaxID=191078 RepID=UPI002A7FB207|nr:cadherin-23-like isoform X2 [Saccostrea echinata]
MTRLKEMKSAALRLLLVLGFLCLGLNATNNPPTLLNFNRYIFVKENFPINGSLGILSARDQDGPDDITFTIKDDVTRDLVRLSEHFGDSTVNRSVEIILIKQLDRDHEPSDRKLYFNLADGQGSSANNLAVQVTLFISDVNDEVPEFVNLRYKESVYENATVGTTVIRVSAQDPDNGLGGTVSYSMEPVAQAADELYKNAFRIDGDTGDIIINSSLDFEKHNFYEFVIKAKDGFGNESTNNADFVLTVLDVQDTPPSFFNLPYSVVVQEDKAVGSQVLQVTALDGDRGVPNGIRYTFVSGDYENFDIDSNTGWITIKTELDRDAASVQNSGGVYAMYVKAEEVMSGVNYGNTTATTLVTISVSDVNDNTPTFNHINYTATIQENMQNGVPVIFTANTIMSVNDIDQGLNSYFEITLEKDGQPYYDFSPLPKEVFSESSILIRVNNSVDLDYEKKRTATFDVIARELKTNPRRSSSVKMTVHILDVNDNQPQFENSSYSAEIPENSPPGTTFKTLKATDQDSGVFGDITYSVRGGNGRFGINNITGEVYNTEVLDREKIGEYYITVEAKDGGGFRTTVELYVKVTDTNDNRPLFTRDAYFASLKEGAMSFIRELKLEATDLDEGINSHVLYSVYHIEPPVLNIFTIHNTTGVVNLTRVLDYELVSRDQVLLEVQACDQGSPRLCSNINVTIDLEDENDNAPIFNQSIYHVDIYENATIGSQVMKVHAYDLDGTAPNNEFVFRIESTAQDKFIVNFRTGEVTVESELDHEVRSSYTLNISATDRGSVSLEGFCLVQINVLDVNDEVPFFVPSSYSKSVQENMVLGSSIVTITAVDTDSNPRLRYQILKDSILAVDEEGRDVNVTANHIQDYFDIQTTNGTVYVKSAIDRETAERVELKILVQDLNGWQPSADLQTATATLTVTLIDVNDNAPQFLGGPQYQVNVSEGREVNDLVISVSAVDRDKKQTITYSIGQDSINSFQIPDSSVGTVTLKQQLDYESNHVVSFTVIATDSGYPASRLTSIATVLVSLTDINDNTPIFQPYSTQYSVEENKPNGTFVGTINATDRDSGRFGEIFYSMQVTNDDHSLTIDSNTGTITVLKPLDREVRDEYILYVTATDNINGNSNQQRSERTQAIFIKVTDVNDNNPVITNVGNIPKTVVENSQNNTIVEVISASDADIGVNAELEFSLVSGHTNASDSWFYITTRYNNDIKNNEGVIRTRQSLLGHVGMYYLTVKVQDKGSPSRLASNQTFLIEIIESNENLNQPQFVVPKGPIATLQIKEQQPVGTTVIQVSATDADHGKNAEVHYYLAPEKDYRKFQIHKDTGLLTTKEILDREQQAVYEIKVIANDSGIINVLENSIAIFVQLLDIDDQEPEFPRRPDMEPYILGPVPEEHSMEYCGSVDVAVDRDSHVNNSLIFYYIIGGDMIDHFYLNQTGELYLMKAVDRDGDVTGTPINFINLVIWATPLGYLNIDKYSTPPGTNRLLAPKIEMRPPDDYDTSNTTLLWVQITINDINDHPPKFRTQNLSVGITRKTQFQETIFTLSDEVTDLDLGNNSAHTFHLMSLTIIPEALKNALPNAPVSLSSDGVVRTNTIFQSDMSGYILMDVSAMDQDGKMANASLRISLINDDQRVKVIFRMMPNQVRNFSEAFRSKLEKITGYHIVVDKIQTHENAQGKPETDKTDMFIHGEILKPFSIVSAADLLSKIDGEASALVPVLNEYNILQIVSAIQQEEEKDSNRLLVMGLILLGIILGIPCIVMAIVIFLITKSYQRKLKAATAMVYGQDNDMQKNQLPGTNLHAYENNAVFETQTRF